MLNNIPRYCLWLLDAKPNELRDMPLIMARVMKVKEARLLSKRPSTIKLAERPTLFGEIRQPNGAYLAIPEVSSERRKYIPISYLTNEVIASNRLKVISNTTYYHFGILTSIMHMIWMRYVCGRMKSDYTYSNKIVYNNYPWPESPTDKQKQTVEGAVQILLDTRSQFPESSLADLYDPRSMPPELVKAHQALDKAVDQCYRSQPFTTEAKRIEFLFELYEKYTAGMFIEEKSKNNKKKSK
jgi:hypothetical protein